MSRNIYLDNAATTRMYPEVVNLIEPYMLSEYGNASAAYELGTRAKDVIENAREEIAKCIKAKPKEIYFTSGGSESDNWAIKCIAGEYKHKGKHIITSCIEHHAVLNSCEYLEELGYEITYVPVDSKGHVRTEDIESRIRDDTTLISVMYANNEIGTIMDIHEIGNMAKEQGLAFHTDAVQAVGQIPIDVSQMPIDLLSASAHKFHGPKGVGFLYVREGIKIPSFIHGGGQEMGKRAGTENVAGIMGMALALKISTDSMLVEKRRITKLRDYMVGRIMNEIPDVIYNGDEKNRLPGNVNISIKGIDATTLLILLDEEGICASAGSACSTGKQNVSHVIEAIKVPTEYAMGTLRFSIGSENNMWEINHTVNSLVRNVNLLREI